RDLIVTGVQTCALPIYVTLIPLATGGLSGTLDFGANVQGVALAPDMSQLWVAQGTSIYAAPKDNSGGFLTLLAGGRLTVASANRSEERRVGKESWHACS